MRNSTLLCRRDLLWIALQARHLNENLENNLQLEFFICVFRVFRGLLSSDLRRNLNGYFLGVAYG